MKVDNVDIYLHPMYIMQRILSTMPLQPHHSQTLTTCNVHRIQDTEHDLFFFTLTQLHWLVHRSSHNSLHQVTRARDFSLQNHCHDRLPGSSVVILTCFSVTLWSSRRGSRNLHKPSTDCEYDPVQTYH